MPVCYDYQEMYLIIAISITKYQAQNGINIAKKHDQNPLLMTTPATQTPKKINPTTPFIQALPSASL
jgi:hypothetical protein